MLHVRMHTMKEAKRGKPRAEGSLAPARKVHISAQYFHHAEIVGGPFGFWRV